MKKIIFTVYFLLNLSLAIYGVLLISQSNQFNELLSQRKPPYQPTGDQWKMLSDPKHFPFLKEHMERQNVDIISLNKAISGLSKNTQNLALVICATSILNILAGIKMRKAL